MVPASSQAKPEPEPAGTSAAVPWNSSMTTRSWVTNTVDGAAARKIDVVLRSSSVRNFASSGRGGNVGGGETAAGVTEVDGGASGLGSWRLPSRPSGKQRE